MSVILALEHASTLIFSSQIITACEGGAWQGKQAMRVAVRPNCVAALTDELFVAKSVVATVRVRARPSLVACAITLWDHSQMMSAQATEGDA